MISLSEALCHRRRIAAADDATEYLERTQLAGGERDHERRRAAGAAVRRVVSASPSSLFAALVMVIVGRRDAEFMSSG